ncbi:MAG: hypothetical protein MUD12_08890 [Spirochaetes bacterium]|jgi:DNA-binding Lrp family transcriptional regulator|nr:hypothetical protein [Spirochaetota bacterium]
MTNTVIESAILEIIQREFPLHPRPYSVLAGIVKTGENVVMETVSGLKKRGIIRNISGIFNASSLGYDSALAAFAVPAERIVTAAEAINSHPGVSHNYLRNNRYNLWFTIAADAQHAIEGDVEILGNFSGALDILILKTRHLVKIGVILDIDDSRHEDEAASPVKTASFRPFTEKDKSVIVVLQRDLPVEKAPFNTLITGSGVKLTEDEIVESAIKLMEEGVMRRYSAVLRHANIGYNSNAMTVWKPAGDPMDPEMLSHFAVERSISHLYVRDAVKGRWDYPVFAMIHSRSEKNLRDVVERLASASGIKEYMVLESLREFKKEKIIYFSPEISDWKRKHLND